MIAKLIDRRIIQLEIEKQALKKEEDAVYLAERHITSGIVATSPRGATAMRSATRRTSPPPV